jgi:23S rRNA pseudouridine1911/1915/1917 synthase
MDKPKIIYQDDDVLVLDKPAGLIVNRAETTKGEKTIQDWLEENFPEVFDIKEQNKEIDLKQDQCLQDFYKRSGIVHRLDKETSGLLIVANNKESFCSLQKQFKERLVEKEYIALVYGEMRERQGEINIPIGRLGWNRKKFGIVPGGRESLTYYKVLGIYTKDGEIYSLLSLNPKTGRTHQIRVHLKALGHPVFGDILYSGRKRARQARKILPRQFLHARKIVFTHPKTGQRLIFESDLSQELNNFLSRLVKVPDLG